MYDGAVSIAFKGTDGAEKALKDNLQPEAGEIIHASIMIQKHKGDISDEIDDCLFLKTPVHTSNYLVMCPCHPRQPIRCSMYYD